MTIKEDIVSYWDSIYTTSDITKLSWHQEYTFQSIELIKKSNLRHDAKIIDVGSGTSSLIQERK